MQPALDAARHRCGLGGLLAASRSLLPVVAHLAPHGEPPITCHQGKLDHIGFHQIQVIDEVIVRNGQVQGLVTVQIDEQSGLVAVGMALVTIIGNACAVKVALQIGIHVVHRHVAHLHALAVGLEGGRQLVTPLGGVLEKHACAFHHAAAVDDLHRGTAPLLVVVQFLDVDAGTHSRALHSMT